METKNDWHLHLQILNTGSACNITQLWKTYTRVETRLNRNVEQEPALQSSVSHSKLVSSHTRIRPEPWLSRGSNFVPREYFAIRGDIFGWCIWVGGERGWFCGHLVGEARRLLNVLQCKGKPSPHPTTKNYSAQSVNSGAAEKLYLSLVPQSNVPDQQHQHHHLRTC